MTERAAWVTDLSVACLRAMWAAGASHAAIAAALGISEGQVLGKARHLGLPGRPVLSAVQARAALRPRPGRSTLPPLDSDVSESRSCLFMQTSFLETLDVG